HPQFARFNQRGEFENYRLPRESLPPEAGSDNYADPIGQHPNAATYQRRWLAAQRPVEVRGHPTGWNVVVQEEYDAAIGETLDRLRDSFINSGMLAVNGIIVVLGLLWVFVVRVLLAPSQNLPPGLAADAAVPLFVKSTFDQPSAPTTKPEPKAEE
ncbi:MAG: hypothetical protein SGJ20_12850, partial [Planctomycetota bacterium]|nr:hypothetical protein [Planctomycetota bacterium]